MKKLGWMILHSGSPYLQATLEAMAPQVDHTVILYTAYPSQGFGADIPCPDSQDQLLELAKPFMDKITWVDGRWDNEAAHCNAVFDYADGYDWLWRADADEIIHPGMVDEMIRQAEKTDGKVFGVPFLHFWRCFHRVCRDAQKPIRLMRMNGGNGQVNLDAGPDKHWTVFHGGYAQPSKFIRYKMLVSGHRPEWRPNWYAERWLVNAQRDTHPVMYPTHWHTEEFDKNLLPDVLKSHRYFSMSLIEEE